MDILRFITAGSVDDGKSTLIGRLFYDSNSLLVDQLAMLEKHSKVKTAGAIDLALITDGLRSEREQGITIDVAYKYFSTPKRKFIVIDAPGHVQYTRNMITGASNSELIILLIDARLGVVEQTKRHSLIAHLLQIPRVLVAINKMDLVDYDENKYKAIKEDYLKIAQSIGLKNIDFLPMSALKGENIVEKSQKMAWFNGKSLIDYLETTELNSEIKNQEARFQVQYVIRPQTEELHDYRGYAGKMISGEFKVGDKIKILPQEIFSVIESLEVYGKKVNQVVSPQSVTLLLKDAIDISRGDSFVEEKSTLIPLQEAESLICWMDNKVLKPGDRFLFQHQSKITKCIVTEIIYKIDIHSFNKLNNMDEFAINEIGKIRLKFSEPIAFDDYTLNRKNGGAILINETSNLTVGALMLIK